MNLTSTFELPPPDAGLDELAQLEMAIALRADELVRRNAEHHPDRNFWEEAESEIWAARLCAVEPARPR